MMTATTSIWCRCRLVRVPAMSSLWTRRSMSPMWTSPAWWCCRRRSPRSARLSRPRSSDPDGVLGGVDMDVAAQARAAAPGSDITSSATSRQLYAPAAGDEGYDLRVVATYLDRTGTGTDTVRRAGALSRPAPRPAHPTTRRASAAAPSCAPSRRTRPPALRSAQPVRATDSDPDDTAKTGLHPVGHGRGPVRHRRFHGPDPCRLGRSVGPRGRSVRPYSVTVTADRPPQPPSGDVSVTIDVADANETPMAGPRHGSHRC